MLLIAGIAAMMDLQRMKVENEWILFSLCTGLFWRIFAEGISGVLSFAAGIAVPILTLGVLFYFRMLGAGDIKTFCALGGMMGASDICKCMAVSFLIGAVLAFVILMTCNDSAGRLKYFIEYLRRFIFTGKAEFYYKQGNRPENFHFTIPIFMSVMLYAGGVY